MTFRFYLPLLLTILSTTGWSQGTVYGVKGGFTLANQNFDAYTRQNIGTWHADVFLETLPEDKRYTLYAQLGPHTRGSSINFPAYTNQQGMNVSRSTEDFRFLNLALQIGGKQKFEFKEDLNGYLMVGIRGEYNLSSSFPRFYENLEDEVNKVTYGVSFGAGIETLFSEYVGGLIEVSVHPDFGEQVLIPAQQSLISSRVIPEKGIKNMSIEITLGLRFLHKVIYVD